MVPLYLAHGSVPRAHAANFALLEPMDRTLARLGYQGKVRTMIEAVGGADQEIVFADGKRTSEATAALENRERSANAMVSLENVGTPASVRRTRREHGSLRDASGFHNVMASPRPAHRIEAAVSLLRS